MRVASAALVPSVALAVAGCGDASPKPHVRSASFRAVSAVRGLGSCAGRGVVDFERRLGELRLDCSKLGGGRLRFLEVGDDFYFGGANAGSLPGHKQWISSHLQDRPQSIIAAIGGVDPFHGRGPTEMLDYLRSHGSAVSKVGSETVRGTRTTRYHGTLPGPRHTRLAVDLWADDDRRVRRIRTGYPSGAPLTVTVDLVRFDVPVTTVAPPRSTVMTLADYEAYARKQLKRRYGGLLHLYGSGG
jgi:hypothetical protein